MRRLPGRKKLNNTEPINHRDKNIHSALSPTFTDSVLTMDAQRYYNTDSDGVFDFHTQC